MINFKVIAFVIGFLLILTGVLLITSLIFSFWYGSGDHYSILFPALFIIAVGSALNLSFRKNYGEVRKREGYLIVTLGWIIMSAAGALPFVINGSFPSYTDAFFETMSGFTTTGATILTDIEIIPEGLLFWRSMTHWIGGMGIILLSVAILPLLGVGGMQLFNAEVAGPSKDKIHPRVRETAKRLWGIYVFLTALQTFLYLLGGMSLFDSLCHSFGTLASGGFSTKNASIAHYQSPYFEYVTIIFMFIAGTNFTLHYFALHGKFSSYFKDEEFRFYTAFIIIIAAASTLYLIFHNNFFWERALRETLFSFISILSSTGFANSDYESWAPFFSTIFLILLLFGACAGSTSGGIKMIRHYLLLKNSMYELKRLIHPQAVIPVRFNGKAVSHDIIIKIAAFVLLYLSVWVFGSVIMSISGLEFSSAFGSVAACLGNIGPGLGSTGPVANYSHLSDFGKWFLSAIMLLGRLEIYTVLLIFTPSLWKG
jgi:trk system potassium uptake protein